MMKNMSLIEKNGILEGSLPDKEGGLDGGPILEGGLDDGGTGWGETRLQHWSEDGCAPGAIADYQKDQCVRCSHPET